MKVILFANTDWYLYNFRLSLAQRLVADGHKVVLTSPAGTYAAQLQALGFHWVEAPMQRRSLNPLREIRLVLWLARLISRERADIVHGFTLKPAVYSGLAARLSAHCYSVCAVAGMGYVFTSGHPRARLLRPIVRSLIRLAFGSARNIVILQNPDDVSLFKNAGLADPQRIRRVPGSGVNCLRFSPAPVQREGTRFRVVLAARLLWDKGLAEYIEAARQLRAKNVPVDFLLAGDPDVGNPAAASSELIAQWVREGLVDWLGHVDDMPALFRSVDCMVLPSYREGLPKGLIEAGAAGLALITTDVPGCREVVTHEVDGLLVPPRDATALAEAIARLGGDPALRRQLGAAARHKAITNFDEQIIIDGTIAAYRDLTSGGRGNSMSRATASSENR